MPDDVTRRDALRMGLAAAASAALPAGVAAAAESAAQGPLAPAYVVGTPGEYDWIFVRARSEEQAILQWLDDRAEDPADHCDAEHCVCESFKAARACAHYAAPDIAVERAEELDAIAKPTPGDWMRAGFCLTCSRCGYEINIDDGGRGVGDEAVCEECMTLADWEIVDPERAKTMREEIET
jgi:hypothetical protein